MGTMMAFDRRWNSGGGGGGGSSSRTGAERTAGRYGGGAPARQIQSGAYDMQNQLQSFWDMGRAANAPADTAINNNINSYMQQLGLLKANQQTETGNINQDNSYGLERLGISREGLGIQQGALARQNLISPEQHRLAMEALAQREQEAWHGAQGQQRQLSSQATTSGNLQSQGAREGFGNIQQQLEFGLKDIGRSREGENLQFNERQAGLADQKKSLDLAAKGLDIDGRELATRTQRALQQLGLQTSLSVQDVTRAINDLNAGRYNPLQAMLGTIYQASGVKPVAR